LVPKLECISRNPELVRGTNAFGRTHRFAAKNFAVPGLGSAFLWNPELVRGTNAFGRSNRFAIKNFTVTVFNVSDSIL
jgi:hypothetical protein